METENIPRAKGSETNEPSKPSRISPPIIAKWLLIFAKNYRVEITEGVPEIWMEAFKDASDPRFELACAKHLKTSRFFPSVADIQKYLELPAEDAALLESERAWDKILWIAGRWGIDEETHEFMPIYSKGNALLPPVLTPAENYALRQIGWYEAIDRQDPEKMTWMRRDFMAAHKRFIETDGLKQIPAGAAEMLTPGPAPQLTAGMQSLSQILKSKQ